MEDDLKELAAKACRQIMQSLKHEPSVILEGDEAGGPPDSVLEDIEAWLFHRRYINGNTKN